MRLACAGVYLRIGGAGRARFRQPSPDDATLTALAVHRTCGRLRKVEIAGSGGTPGSPTSWMTNALATVSGFRKGGRHDEDAAESLPMHRAQRLTCEATASQLQRPRQAKMRES